MIHARDRLDLSTLQYDLQVEKHTACEILDKCADQRPGAPRKPAREECGRLHGRLGSPRLLPSPPPLPAQLASSLHHRHPEPEPPTPQRCVFSQPGGQSSDVEIPIPPEGPGGSLLPLPAPGAPGVPGLWPRPSGPCLHRHVASPVGAADLLCLPLMRALGMDLGPTG